MENQGTPEENAKKAIGYFMDVVKRQAAFMEEHGAYINALFQKAAEEGTILSPTDPQVFQELDNILQEIEDTGEEDTIENYEEIKYKQMVHYQLGKFRLEMQEAQYLMSKEAVAAAKRFIDKYQPWLDNAKKRLAQNGPNAELEANVEMVEKQVLKFKMELPLLELKVATYKSDSLN